MYKKLLFICFIFLLAGCTNINTNKDYVSLIENCFTSKNMTNDVSLGYKYYVPKGVEKIHDYDYNQVFLSNNCSIYLYVDIISYYYKKDLQYKKTGNEFYYETFQNGSKKGYIRIEQDEDIYFVSIVYNYSKVEFYSTFDNLNKLITLSSIMLNSINYNNTVIEKVLEGNLGEFSEFTYEVKKPDGSNSNFSQYLEEYVQKEEQRKKEKLPDE